MELKLNGKIIKGVGGLYEIRIARSDADMLRGVGMKIENDTVLCKARGVFRHEKLTLLVGDDVVLRVDTELALASDADARENHKRGDEAMGGVMIEEALPRRNELIRPPMANLDIIFAVFAAAKPEPALTTVDKLITIAEYKEIEPVVIITKADLAPDAAEHYADIYRRCGFRVFIEGLGIDGGELEGYIRENADRVSVFAGASGVGKSTLMNRLFPSLGLATGEISQKTQRGRHTTRHIELYPLDRQFGDSVMGCIADTPGFGMLDFVQFDFYTKADLPYVFREFEPYIGSCRYTKCTHTKEDGCALLEAVKNGEIPEERHKSYLEFYEVLKNKHEWDKK
ncbi:MAG: ribosome small subunit-dependent GTPase A [Clostridia bacterium]|nr:ribosome small subunit-dependent GTPase A [Clostridia bacterium]